MPAFAGRRAPAVLETFFTQSEKEELWCEEMVEESENSLVWVIVMEGDPDEIILGIMALECDVERCNAEYFAIPTVKLSKVTRFLTKHEKQGVLVIRSPFCGQ